MKKIILATLTTGVLINLSEFLRNEILLKEQWLDKFSSMGLPFPSAAINGLLWIVWGFVFAGCVVAICRRFSFAGALLLSWTMGFLLMWVVTGNLGILPMGLMPIAVPWSVAEVALAVFVAQRLLRRAEKPNNKGCCEG